MKTSAFKTSFTENDFQDWQNKLIKEIKIQDYNQAIKKDRNGIDIHPIFTTSTTQLSNTHRQHDEWWIVSPFIVNNNESHVNAQILQQLNEGVTGIKLKIESSQVDPLTLLANIDLNAIQIIWTVNDISTPTIDIIMSYLLSQEYDIKSGLFHIESSNIYDFNLHQVHVNALVYNNAGASSLTELSSALSQLNEGLHHLQSKNSLDQLLAISVSVAVDTHYFEQIAKLRAYRTLFQHVCHAYSIQVPIYIHVETSHIFLTQKDVNNNLIRNTIAAMAAVVGGADSLTIAAHNHYLSQNENDNRLAKNQQLLLKEEAHFNEFLNAADGSYFLDYYTDQLCEKAYSDFQKLEDQGGWSENLSKIALQINNDKVALIEAYNSNTQTLIGINKYSNQMENVDETTPTLSKWQGFTYVNLEHEINP